MPIRRPSLLLSPMRGGINRFRAEASPEQTVDALDVVVDDGDLRRRDAFRSITTAAPHFLPAASTVVGTITAAGASQTIYGGRNPSTAAAAIGYLYVGALEPFDGLDVRHVTLTGSLTVCNRRISLQYYTGSGWADAWALDSTFVVPDGSSYGQSLSRDGRVTWHRSLFVDSTTGDANWATASPSGLGVGFAVGGGPYYWVRAVVKNTTTGAVTNLGGTVAVDYPGVMAFLLNPVNLLSSVRLRTNRTLVIGSDRVTQRGMEPGGKLAAWRFSDDKSKQLMVVEDEGAGVYDVATWPQWQKGGVNVGSSGLTVGTAGMLTKHKTTGLDSQGRSIPYTWTATQFFGSPVVENLVVLAGSTGASVKTATITSVVTGRYERLLLVYTSGAQSGLLNDIVACTSSAGVVTFTVDPDSTGGAPSAGDTFKIVRAAFLRTSATGDKDFLIKASAAHTATLSTTSQRWAAAIANAGITGKQVFWEIGRHVEWVVSAGERYSSVYDTTTGQVILTNGNSGLLTYDGRRLRRLAADTTSEAALQVQGILPDRPDLVGGTAGTLTPSSTLRTQPPAGRFLVDFHGTLVVAGFNGRPNDIEWSMPTLNNNIWPRVFTAVVRDSRGDPITGLATLGESLLVFTNTAIFVGAPPDNRGVIAFRSLAQGIGFVSHHAVARIILGGANAMIGASPDGIGAVIGGQVTTVLDRWSRILDGGVNEARLRLAVATALPQRKAFVLAVTSRGGDSNDRLIWLDYSGEVPRFWVWSHPFGVSALATAVNEAGKEYLLIGTDDGHVQTLSQAPDDDGVAIDAYAKSPPIQPFGDSHGAFLRAFLTMSSMGRGQTVDVSFLLDDSNLPFQSSAVPVAGNQATFGYTTFESGAHASKWADAGMRTIQCQLRPGAKGVQFAFQVGGSARWRLREAHVEARALGARPR